MTVDDYLIEAKRVIERAEIEEGEEAAQTSALLAIACAQVAQAQLLAAQTKLLAALIERLDALTDGDDCGGKALFVTLTK